MRKNSISNLWRIVHSLKKEEIENCTKFLKSFDTRGFNSEKKGSTFFDELLKDKIEPRSSDEYMFAIYGNNTSNQSFVRLISRLRNKILESLIFDINIERKEAFSDRSQMIVSVKKRCIYAMLLRARSKSDLALQYLDNIIKDGTNYELWDDVIYALKAKREMVALMKGKFEYQKVHRQLLNAKKASYAVSKAQYHVQKIGLIANYGTWMRKNSIELRNTIVELRELKEKTKSVLCEYNLRLIEVAFYQGLEDFEKAEYCLKKIVDLIDSKQVLKHELKKANAILNLAQNHIYQGNFITGLLKSTEAVKDIDPNHNVAIRGLELQFYSIFYNGEYLKAFTFLNKAQKDIEHDGWDFYKGKLLYLRACTSFCIHNFEAVDNDLVFVNPIENDKNGYNIYLRILLIMNSISRSKFDLATDYIESFRKQLSYLKKGQPVAARVKNIYTILNMLSTNAFDFPKTLLKIRTQLNELESLGNSKWKILSPELIIFEQWFLANAEGKMFNQTIKLPEKIFSNLKVV